MRWITGRVACVLFVLLAIGVAPRGAAQPLAEHVPQDALVYVGWAGAQHLGAGYAQSNLKALLDVSQIPELIEESLPRLFENLGHQDQDSEAFLAFLSAVGKPMWKHPSAFYFGGVDLADPNFPMPRIAFICRAGDEAKDMVRTFNELLTKYGQPPIPVRAEESDGVAVISIGNVDFTAAKKPAVPLTQRREFQQAMATVGAKQPIAALYVDVESGVEMFENALRQFDPQTAGNQWPRVKDGLGLASLKRVVWVGGFDGKDFAMRAFVESPEPRSGLAKALLDTRPLSDETLKAVPATATMAFAGHLDVANLLGEIRAMVQKVDENGARDFEQGLEQIRQAIGMDLQTEVLACLGDEWAIYIDPSVGGEGVLGFALVNRLKDAAKAEKALTQLEQLANGALKEAMAGDKIVFSFQTMKQGDLTIHYFAVPVVAPSWAIRDGNLYIGLYPQVVSGAASHVAKKRPSILENQAFAAIRRRLTEQGQTQISGFEYNDLPRIAASGYQEILMWVQSWLGAADLFGAKTPALALPTLSKLKPLLKPSAGVYWADKNGWHYKSIEPFPGSDLLALGGMGPLFAAQQAIGVGAIVPELIDDRRDAMRNASANNLRILGQAIQLYANDNKGALPGSLGELLLTQDVGAHLFINPATRNRLPDGKNKEELAVWVNTSGDYTYVGAGKKVAANRDTVITHEKILPNSRSINVLFIDGRVENMHHSEVSRRVAEQNKAPQAQ